MGCVIGGPMDDRLKHFKTLVEQRSFTAAARHLHISQPALSTSLAKLEKEVGASLIVRGPGRFEVTEAGDTTYEFACRRAVGYAEFQQRLARMSGARGMVRIGAIDSVADIICEDEALLAELERSCDFSLTVSNSESLSTAVDRMELDFALVVAGPTPLAHAEMHRLTVGDEPLLDVGRHPAAGGCDERLISYHRDSVTYSVVREAFAEHGRPAIAPEMFSSSPQTMLRLVRLGRGHAVLPYTIVGDGLLDNSLAVRPVGTLGYVARPVAVVYRYQHRAMPDVVDRIATLLRSQVYELGPILERIRT